MLALLLGVVLFAMTHPLGKFFLNQGLSVQTFCVVFLGIRILLQIPILHSSTGFRINTRSQWLSLFLLGLIGAALHLSEFASLNLGLSVPTVSFIIFTHPLWTLLFSILYKKEKVTSANIVRIALALMGMACILFSESPILPHDFRMLIPIVASVCFSLWILLSQQIQKEGVPTLQMSFYYDSLSFLLVLFATALTRPLVSELAPLFHRPLTFWFAMVGYAFFVGILANYLFFIGVKAKGAMTASYTLLLEPVISSVIAVLLFKTYLVDSFFMGAALILLVNLPQSLYAELLSRPLRSPKTKVASR